MKKFTIFVDLDGVLADLEKGFKDYFGKSAHQVFRELGDKKTWKEIDGIDHFWRDLSPIKDAEGLWNYIEEYSPTVLTKPAISVKQCKEDKKEWVKNYLGEDVKVIFSADKYKYAKENAILIDDTEENTTKFENAGGISILHTSAKSTIKKLEKILNKRTAMETPNIELQHAALSIMKEMLTPQNLVDLLLELDIEGNLLELLVGPYQLDAISPDYSPKDALYELLSRFDISALQELAETFLQAHSGRDQLLFVLKHLPKEVSIEDAIKAYVSDTFSGEQEIVVYEQILTALGEA